MDHEDVGRFWSANAEAWTRLSRAGYDIYRDAFNTPAFFDLLPDVQVTAWPSCPQTGQLFSFAVDPD